MQPLATFSPPTPLAGIGGPRRLAAILLVAIVALGLGVAFSVVRSAIERSSAMPTSPAIEAAWGIRVSQVAATADGGLIDFRFVVLDSELAGKMMTNPTQLPVLAVEGADGAVFSAASMAARHDLAVGRTYFILYRNAGGIIRAGTSVTVVFPDGQRLEHVVAH